MFKIKLILSGLVWALLAVNSASAADCTIPCTKNQLSTDIVTNLPNNTSGQITPTKLRTILINSINSIMPNSPVVSGNLACFNGSTGLLQDCGSAPIATLPVTSITGMGAGCNSFLVTPSSANLRGCVTDETGTGSAYFQGGDLGTPSAGIATNLIGTAAGLTAGTASSVPVSGITGLGTGVSAALGTNIGSAGAPLVFNGAGGTPSSMIGTNITGTAAGLTAGVASAVAVGGITGAGTGCITWLTTPSSANLRGCLTDESGTGVAYFQGGDLGTPSAGVATNITALNATQLTTGAVPAARMPALTGDCTTTVGTVATTCTSINGVNQTTAWTSYTAAAACTTGAGTFSTTASRSKALGKTIFWQIDTTITAIGTCTLSQFQFTLPSIAQSAAGGVGRETAILGTNINCSLAAGSALMVCKLEGATAVAVNHRYVASGVYEAQ